MKKVIMGTWLMLTCTFVTAQQSVLKHRTLSIGMMNGTEFFLHSESKDQTGKEPDYKLQSSVYYLKYMIKQPSLKHEFGMVAAASFGKVENGTSTPDVIYIQAEQKRYSFSFMYRYNHHFVNKNKINIYAGAGSGIRCTVYSRFRDESTASDDQLKRFFIPVALEITGGIRYFPLKHFGLYAEAGMAKTPVQAGAAFKF